MGGVRIDHLGNAPLEEVLELGTIVHPLAEAERDGGHAGQALGFFHRAGRHRVFHEDGPQRLELAQQHAGHGQMHSAVEVEGEVHPGPTAARRSKQARNDLVHLGIGVDDLHLAADVELAGVVARADQCFRAFDQPFGPVARDPAVASDAVAHGPAQQRVEWAGRAPCP
jgi:hypothetical protein